MENRHNKSTNLEKKGVPKIKQMAPISKHGKTDTSTNLSKEKRTPTSITREVVGFHCRRSIEEKQAHPLIFP